MQLCPDSDDRASGGADGRHSSQGQQTAPEPSAGADATAFDVRIIHTDGEAVVVVRGEIDLSHGEHLWAAVEEALSLSDRLVIDFSGTTFIDSTGLGILVRAQSQLGPAGGPIVIRSPSQVVRRLLSVSGIDQHVAIEDVPEA